MSRKIHSSLAYYRRKRRQKGLLILLLTLTVAAACFLFLFFFPTRRVGEGVSAEDGRAESVLPPESAASSAVSVDVSMDEVSKETPRTAGDASAASETASPSVSEEEPDVSGAESVAYDYAKPVPASDPVDNSYFDQVVFVGNSRTQGFVLYSGLSNLTAYTDKGLTVETAATKEIVPDSSGNKMTVLEALRENNDCKAVYMMFGINELGWTYSSVFVDKYADLVDAIQQNHPGVPIYLQSILPVGKVRSDEDPYVNNDRIRSYNELIQQLAEEKQVYYLNVYEAVADENGVLPEDAAVDGVHLKKPYCEKWLEYLKTHVAPDLEPPEV